MENYKLDYWIESVSASMDNAGYTLPIEDITAIAEDMIITAEQESMAFGYDAIPNPLQTEVDKINDRLQQERENWNNREDIYVKSIATRNGVQPEDVFIDGNSVMYRERGLL